MSLVVAVGRFISVATMHITPTLTVPTQVFADVKCEDYCNRLINAHDVSHRILDIRAPCDGMYDADNEITATTFVILG